MLPTNNVPFSGATINTDPGLFFPKLMVGSRDYQVFPVYGQEKDEGALDYSFFPTNGDIVLAAAIGADAQAGTGVTGSAGGTVNTTLSSGTSAGASTINLASTSGITVGSTIVQIDTNNLVGPTTSECRLITNLVGSTATLDAPLVYAHSNGVAVVSKVAPFVHTITQLPVLNSLTIEKNLGNFQSLQFAGCRVNKWELKGQATNTEATVTADVVAQSWAVLNSPSAVSIVDEQPFAFSEFTLTWNGNVMAQATNFTLTIDNGVTPEWTFNGSHQAQFVPALHLMVSGQFDGVWDSLTDSTYGLWSQAVSSETEAELELALTYPNAPAYGCTFQMHYVRLAKDDINPNIDRVISETASFQARRSMSGTPSETIRAILTNGSHLPVL